jgi:deaminated glutathione amidase
MHNTDMTTIKIACLQTNTGNDLAANLTTVRAGLREAAANGAQWILTPEYTLMMDGSGRVMRDNALPADGGASLAELKSMAKELKVWLLIGSLTLRTGEEGEGADTRIVNRSFLISSEGEAVATYDKIHMFDVTLPDGKVIRESSAYRPGDKAVVVETPLGKVGLTICYDLRFPQLFRTLAQAGAQIITVPSSFQRQTGKAHWHPLLQARAIENGCFVIAPAMCGDHAGNRQTFGHSLVVNPWGEVIADGGEGPGIVYAEIDVARVAKVRGMIPSLTHDRVYEKA